MKGILTITHTSIEHGGALETKLRRELDKVLGPSKVNNKKALKESKEFRGQMNEVHDRVFCAFHPFEGSIAVCFRHSDSYFDVHIESRNICEACERAAETLRSVFSRLRASPKISITLEEDSGEQTGISSGEVNFVSLLKEKLGRENFFSAAITAAISLGLSYLYLDLLPSALVTIASLIVIVIFGSFSLLLERWDRPATFKWVFEK